MIDFKYYKGLALFIGKGSVYLMEVDFRDNQQMMRELGYSYKWGWKHTPTNIEEVTEPIPMIYNGTKNKVLVINGELDLDKGMIGRGVLNHDVDSNAKIMELRHENKILQKVIASHNLDNEVTAYRHSLDQEIDQSTAIAKKLKDRFSFVGQGDK